MKRHGPLACIVLLSSLAASGCAERWHNIAGADDFASAEKACQQRAAEKYPPIVRQIQVEPARTTPLVTSCSGVGASLRCGMSGGQYVPPRFMPVDDNALMREQEARACLREKGWRPASEK